MPDAAFSLRKVLQRLSQGDDLPPQSCHGIHKLDGRLGLLVGIPTAALMEADAILQRPLRYAAHPSPQRGRVVSTHLVKLDEEARLGRLNDILGIQPRAEPPRKATLHRGQHRGPGDVNRRSAHPRRASPNASLSSASVQTATLFFLSLPEGAPVEADGGAETASAGPKFRTGKKKRE